MLDNGWKNAIPNASRRNGIFAKSSRWATSRQCVELSISQSLNVLPPSETRVLSCVDSATCLKCPGIIGETRAGSTHGKAAQKFTKVGVTTSPTCLGLALAWSQQNYQRLLKSVRASSPPSTASYAALPRGKAGLKMQESIIIFSINASWCEFIEFIWWQ